MPTLHRFLALPNLQPQQRESRHQWAVLYDLIVSSHDVIPLWDCFTENVVYYNKAS